MNALAHLTASEVPLWLAVLVAGICLGMAATLAVLGRITRRK